jgi:hypothetical protein
MTIVLYLGKNVKEYNEHSKEIIKQYMKERRILCDVCTQQMRRHSSYTRGIKETGQNIEITLVYCRKCRKGHALLPDFLLPYKQYSGDEIEGVIIDSGTLPVSQIDTDASESTVRRWLVQIGERINMAMGVLKYLFMQMGRIISEAMIEAGRAYSELEQILSLSPNPVKHSGNKLGLANLWLGKHSRKRLI